MYWLQSWCVTQLSDSNFCMSILICDWYISVVFICFFICVQAGGWLAIGWYQNVQAKIEKNRCEMNECDNMKQREIELIDVDIAVSTLWSLSNWACNLNI